MYRTYKVLLHKLESRIIDFRCTFSIYITLRNHFRQYKDKVGITANFCSNNSDGRIWAFYSTYLTLDRDYPGKGLIQFVKTNIIVLHYLNG